MGRVRAVHIGITGFTTLNEPTHFIAFAHAGRKRPRTNPTEFSYLWMRLDFTSNLGLLMRPTCWEPRPGILWLRPRTERIEDALYAHEVLWVPGVPRLLRICIPGTNYSWRFSADAIH